MGGLLRTERRRILNMAYTARVHVHACVSVSHCLLLNFSDHVAKRVT